MLLTNRLFFEQVEAMLAEGHEVQIRMKGHSMRPLLRNERDIAELTPIAKYARHLSRQPGHLRIPSPKPAPPTAMPAPPARPDFPATPPARHPTCTHPPAAPAIRLRRRAASAPCGRATSSCFAAKGAISCTASSGSKQASAAKETVPYAHQPQGMPRPLRHPRKTPQRGIPPRGHSVSPCPGTVITARRSIASARISSP